MRQYHELMRHVLEHGAAVEPGSGRLVAFWWP